MPLVRCLPALALLIFLPARADARRVEAKKAMSCCAGEEGADKAPCPKAKAGTTAESRKQAVKKTSAATAVQAAAPAPPPAGAANMVVTRDPETGELRNATAAEREKLFAGRAPQASGVAPRVIVLPDGTKMVELGEDSMSYAIATKAPDGSIKQSCVHGAHSATEARTAPKPAPAPRAEER